MVVQSGPPTEFLQILRASGKAGSPGSSTPSSHLLNSDLHQCRSFTLFNATALSSTSSIWNSLEISSDVRRFFQPKLGCCSSRPNRWSASRSVSSPHSTSCLVAGPRQGGRGCHPGIYSVIGHDSVPPSNPLHYYTGRVTSDVCVETDAHREQGQIQVSLPSSISIYGRIAGPSGHALLASAFSAHTHKQLRGWLASVLFFHTSTNIQQNQNQTAVLVHGTRNEPCAMLITLHDLL